MLTSESMTASAADPKQRPDRKLRYKDDPGVGFSVLLKKDFFFRLDENTIAQSRAIVNHFTKDFSYFSLSHQICVNYLIFY